MFCKYCGQQIDKDSAFCQHCGKKQHDKCEEIQLKSEIQGKNTVKIAEKLHTENKTAQLSISKMCKTKQVRIVASLILVLAVITVLFLTGIIGGFRRELSASEIAKLSDSVLTLYVYDENHDLLSTGSGFVVNDDITIVTNYHVINQGHFVEAISEKDVHYNISGVTFYDEAADIAVLKFETGTGITPLIIADSSTAQVGDTIYAIGSPLGLKNIVSNGIISAIRDDGNNPNIQVTAPISPGSSGGVLLNIYGEALGITSASYTEGQNLNLVIPSAKFTDKLQSSEIQKFEDIALFTTPLGNSIVNYSANETRLVQYGNSIYEAYNSNDEISVYDINTKESKKLGINGTNLSVYRGLLYYISSDSSISTYNISTGEICENILLNYPTAAQVDEISALYVSNHGISVIYNIGILKTALIQLDFEGKIIGSIDALPYGPIVADADTLVASDMENCELEFISLANLECISIPVPFVPGFPHVDKNGDLYIANTTVDYGELVKFDPHTGNFMEISLLGACSYAYSVFDGEIYYPSINGTTRMSAHGFERETINTTYALDNICFSDDGKLYAIGRTISDLNDLWWAAPKYYIRVDSDGSQLEVLD